MKALPTALVCTPFLAAVALGCGDDDGDDGSGGSGNAGGASGGTATGGMDTGGMPTGGMGGSGGATGGMGGGAQSLSVTIDFDAQVDGTPFDCTSTYQGIGTGADEVSFRDFRFYVSNVRLLQAGTGTEVPVALTDDGLWQHQPAGMGPEAGVVLIDFEDNLGSCQNGTTETNASIIGEVPQGDYDGVAFDLGVPGELNHDDVAVAPSPLNLSAMFWNWAGGYKHVRIDVEATGAAEPFNFHLGSTMCTGDPLLGEDVTCMNPNRPEIRLTNFDFSTQTIVIDYADLVAGADVGINAMGAPGCMSGPTDPDCPPVFGSVGIDHSNGQPTGSQSAFSVE